MGEENERHFQRYFEVFQRRRSPEEVEETFEALGTHTETMQMIASLQARRDRWEWSAQLWQNVRTILVWGGLGSGALGLIGAALLLVERLIK